MKSRERLLDEGLERANAEIARLKARPTFIIRMKKNAFGQIGPTLCWPDGSTVGDQIECEVTHRVDALVHVRVEFSVTGKLITIKEDADVCGEKEQEDAPTGEAGAGDAQGG